MTVSVLQLITLSEMFEILKNWISPRVASDSCRHSDCNARQNELPASRNYLPTNLRSEEETGMTAEKSRRNKRDICIRLAGTKNVPTINGPKG